MCSETILAGHYIKNWIMRLLLQKRTIDVSCNICEVSQHLQPYLKNGISYKTPLRYIIFESPITDLSAAFNCSIFLEIQNGFLSSQLTTELFFISLNSIF